MKLRTGAVPSALILVSMMVAAVWAWLQVPADQLVPIHWGLDGEPDRFVSAGQGLFLLPIIGAVIWGLLLVIPRLDPRDPNLSRSENAYGTIWVAAFLVLGLAQGIIVASALAYELNVPQVAAASVGGMLILVGNVFGKLRANFFAGIRTPWTLSDERVWNLTHRFSGRLFVVAGVVVVIAAIMVEAAEALAAITVFSALMVCLVSYIWSYVLWRRVVTR